MTLTSEQKRATLLGPCFALDFLVRTASRNVARKQMEGLEGLSDAAIFHRWMDLCWTLREPVAIAILTFKEKQQLGEFNAVYAALPWQPIESHPHISEVGDEELSKLLPSAARLLDSLERRTRLPILKRWWRKALSFFRLR